MPLPFSLLPHNLSVSSSQAPLLDHTSHLHTYSLSSRTACRGQTLIRMGGGPRTYPGGVSKWQWKRMQEKKAKQLLQARLSRERQVYEMRKRAELRAAVSELERPWERTSFAPNLFSVPADEQLKVLADRFQRPGGIDLWTERDGPQLFAAPDGTPSARFFPKGVVYSVRPYVKMSNAMSKDSESSIQEDGDVRNNSQMRSGRRRYANRSMKFDDSPKSQEENSRLRGAFDSDHGSK